MSYDSSLYGGAGVSPETFQGIILERNAEVKEKAQLKRIQDLKRIQEMKSRGGRNPLEIFPKEIWALILQKLNPEDRGYMSDLHPVFHDLMQSSHLRDNLFPQVLSKLKTTTFWRSEEHQRLRRIPIPLAFNQELRKVCRSLRDGVDRFFEDRLVESLWEDLKIKNIYKRTLFQFQEPFEEIDEKLDDILNFIRSNPKAKPRFYSRSLAIAIHIERHTINENVLHHFKAFGNKILEFLEEFGNQFCRFEIITCDAAQTRAKQKQEDKLYVPFNMWTSLLPNLKWFTFHYTCKRTSSSCFDFKDLFNQTKIKSLERLDIQIESGAKKDTASFVKAFLIGQPHIKVICMELDKPTPVDLSSMESLEAMAIHLNWEDNYYWNQMDVITGIKTLSQSIKRMELSGNMRYCSIDSIFEYLQGFTSLEQLTLSVKGVTIGGYAIGFLQLPHLQKFSLRIENPKFEENAPLHFLFSLQFLLHSKYLKELKLDIITNGVDQRQRLKGLLERQGKPENMLDLGGGCGWDSDFTNSNIWRVFPYLESVITSVCAANWQGDSTIKFKLRKYWKRELAESHVTSGYRINIHDYYALVRNYQLI